MLDEIHGGGKPRQPQSTWEHKWHSTTVTSKPEMTATKETQGKQQAMAAVRGDSRFLPFLTNQGKTPERKKKRRQRRRNRRRRRRKKKRRRRRKQIQESIL